MNATHAGEMLALAAAVLWAAAIVLFKRSGEHVHPIALNAFKIALSLVLFLPTLYLAGGTLFEPFTRGEYVRMLASGAIGIAISDTLIFQSLNMIGASASALVSTLYSPFMIGFSFLWLGERLRPVQLVGVALIVLAVFETMRVKSNVEVTLGRRLVGVAVGALGLAATAVAVVMIKPLLDRAPLLWALEIRLIGGAVALAAYLAFHPKRRRILATLLVPGSRVYTVTSSFLGAYLAMGCWLGGMKLTKVSIASALNQTNTIFILIFAALFLGERITLTRAVAILAAFAGATLVILG